MYLFNWLLNHIGPVYTLIGAAFGFSILVVFVLLSTIDP